MKPAVPARNRTTPGTQGIGPDGVGRGIAPYGPATSSQSESPTMAPNTKRVFYVNSLSAPVYLEILAKRPDVQIDRLVNDSPDHEAEPILAHAHAFQIGSSRQELAMKYQGYAPLLRRCPNLVVLSTNGAGFATVSLDDATAAGVAVVNQAGGNKEGVAEHVMAMMLSLSKRIMLTDHAMRSGQSYDRRDFMG